MTNFLWVTLVVALTLIFVPGLTLLVLIAIAVCGIIRAAWRAGNRCPDCYDGELVEAHDPSGYVRRECRACGFEESW